MASNPKGIAPIRKYGLDFPHFVFVLSITTPIATSAIPSITLVKRNNIPT
jgi:hypothetical protein